MTFDFHRAKTPAYLTSVALVVLGLLCASGTWVVLGWILAVLGLALNVVAVSITGLNGSPTRARRTGTRVVVDPDPDTQQNDVVEPARERRPVSSGAAASATKAATGGSSAVRPAAPAVDRETFEH